MLDGLQNSANNIGHLYTLESKYTVIYLHAIHGDHDNYYNASNNAEIK